MSLSSLFDGPEDEQVARDILIGVASALMVVLLLKILKV